MQHGTSQAAPVVAGVTLLVQEYYRRLTGSLPKVDYVVACLRQGGVAILDGDDESDNVQNTRLKFTRLDAMGALRASRRWVRRSFLLAGRALR